MDKGRIEAFSDGVFAVAITLLALDLTVAGPGGHHPLSWQLGHLWPQFAAYVVSFFTVGVVWVNHHALFKSLTRPDRTLLFLNLLLLMFVVLIPFATSVMAEYLTAGGWDASLAALLYSAVSGGMAVCFTLIFRWSVTGDHRQVPIPPEQVWPATLRFSAGLLGYAVAMLAALISAPLALAVNAAMTGYYIFDQTPTTAESEG